MTFSGGLRDRDVGSRTDNRAAAYLYETWLPQSGESLGDFPMIFHYVNVGPKVREEEMITDVYLPLMARPEESDLENGNLKS